MSKWILIDNPNYSPFNPQSKEYLYLCPACHKIVDLPDNYCSRCGEKNGTITNIDLVRVMPDEDLADLHGAGCPPNSAEIDCSDYFCDDETKCAKCWLDWFRKEATL